MLIVYTDTYIYPYGQNLDPSGVCFGWYVVALSVRKRIFLKTKKADQKHCENCAENLVQNSTKHPQCASEVSGENSCEIVSLKVWNNPPLAPVPFWAFCGLMVHIYLYTYVIRIYISICVCVHTYVHTYMYTWAYIHVYMYIHKYIHTLHAYAYVYILCMHVYTLMYVYTYVHRNMHTYITGGLQLALHQPQKNRFPPLHKTM